MLRGTKGPRMGGGVGGRGFLVVGMRGSTTSLVTVLTVNLNKTANHFLSRHVKSGVFQRVRVIPDLGFYSLPQKWAEPVALYMMDCD